jgi:hypothetical protein
MSHLRRVVALIILALFGWLVAFGAVGAVAVTAESDSNPTTMSSGSMCC